MKSKIIFIKTLILFISILLLGINGTAIMIGVFESQQISADSFCVEKLRKFEIIVPGFRLGCWLGAEL